MENVLISGVGVGFGVGVDVGFFVGVVGFFVGVELPVGAEVPGCVALSVGGVCSFGVSPGVWSGVPVIVYSGVSVGIISIMVSSGVGSGVSFTSGVSE